METPGLALQLRLSEEPFLNQKCFTNRLIVVKQSEITATYFVSFSENSCMFHCHPSVLWGELNKNKKCLEKEEISCSPSVFSFIMGNIDLGVGSV